MSDYSIKVEGLSKAYQIGRSRERYVALRDILTRRIAGIGRRLRGKSSEAREHSETFWALDDISFELRQGECLGIIGRNGAGKSTLLKLLSRITSPTRGIIRLRGRVGSLLEVGTGFHPELTGRENISLNGAILGMSRREISRKFDAIVAFAEISRFLDTAVKYYSSGMYMRLAFAVAAHLDPEILIVDEVLAVGDAQFQQKCLGKMSEVAMSGRTVLFVSHNLAAVQQLCTVAALMRAGKLHQFGAVTPTISEYFSDAHADESGQFDVSEHPARQRQYHSVIRAITLSDGAGPPRAVFHPDDALVVDLTMALPARVSEPRIAVAIEDSYGRRLMTVANYFEQASFSIAEGRIKVRCRIPKIGLGTGRYLICASIGEKNQPLIDSIDAVVWFRIDWNNNYDNGETFNPVYGPILKRSEWSIID